MAPLTADSLTPRQDATVDDAAATDACSQDDAEDGGRPLAGTEAGLSEGEAVGVVCQFNTTAQVGGEVALQRLTY